MTERELIDVEDEEQLREHCHALLLDRAEAWQIIASLKDELTLRDERDAARLERDEARVAVQDAFGWWLVQSDVRPSTVVRFFEWAEEKWPWMRVDQSALLEEKGNDGA